MTPYCCGEARMARALLVSSAVMLRLPMPGAEPETDTPSGVLLVIDGGVLAALSALLDGGDVSFLMSCSGRSEGVELPPEALPNSSLPSVEARSEARPFWTL